MSNNSLAWFAVQVRSPLEQWLSVTLREKGYEEYLPTYRSRRTWSDRVKEIDQPLFPRYLFCRFDPMYRLPILKTPNVQGIVSIGRAPIAIPDHEIEAVRRMVSEGKVAGPWPYLREGQHVRIRKGPLTGVEGILTEFKNRYRLVVSIELLQRSVAAEVDGDWVEVLHSGSATSRPLARAL
ncbi:MAG: transcription termination/antitermination protein NusG [Bryobacteraceae bacterium]